MTLRIRNMADCQKYPCSAQQRQGNFLVTSTNVPVQAFPLRPDMGACFWLSPSKSHSSTYQLEFSAPCIWFSFVLDGYSTTKLDSQTEQLRTRGTLEIRCVQTGDTITLHKAANKSHKWVDIVLRPDFLTIATPGETKHLPDYIQKMISGETPHRETLLKRMTPDQHIAATQLASCPYTFAARTLYLKSKTLELLSHTVAEHASMSCRTRLSTYEIECLNRAKDYLIQDLTNPPTLKDIAAQVGMCETKLRTRFKAMFGQTVFEYFRNYRIDLARQLLLEDKLSVSKVAYEIGYTNLSHFSAAFKDRHGVNPSKLNKDFGEFAAE